MQFGAPFSQLGCRNKPYMNVFMGLKLSLKRISLGTEMGVEFMVEIGTAPGPSRAQMDGLEVTEMGLEQV